MDLVLNCSSSSPYKVSNIITFILQMRKQRHKEIKQFDTVPKPAGGRTGIQTEMCGMEVHISPLTIYLTVFPEEKI